MKKLLPVLLVGTLVGAAGVLGWAQAKTGEEEIETPRIGVGVLMQAKLESSQALLKGLALEDFDLIKKESQRLELLSMDTDWNIIQTKDYSRISREFQESARQLRKASDQKNLDAAGMGFFKLTMTCIDCHRHVRALDH